jgi:hypothetical protein
MAWRVRVWSSNQLRGIVEVIYLFCLDATWFSGHDGLAATVYAENLEQRVHALLRRRAVTDDNEVAWLLKAVTLIDLTTLNSEDEFRTITGECDLCLKFAREDHVKRAVQ